MAAQCAARHGIRLAGLPLARAYKKQIVPELEFPLSLSLSEFSLLSQAL